LIALRHHHRHRVEALLGLEPPEQHLARHIRVPERMGQTTAHASRPYTMMDEHFSSSNGRGGMAKTAVVALGGNALTREGQAGTHEQLEANATAMARSVSSLLRTGWRVVLVHGNGPQVGNLAIQQEEGARLVPAQPMFALGAMTEGQLGSLICL